jgi:hypothetical protein
MALISPVAAICPQTGAIPTTCPSPTSNETRQLCTESGRSRTRCRVPRTSWPPALLHGSGVKSLDIACPAYPATGLAHPRRQSHHAPRPPFHTWTASPHAQPVRPSIFSPAARSLSVAACCRLRPSRFTRHPGSRAVLLRALCLSHSICLGAPTPCSRGSAPSPPVPVRGSCQVRRPSVPAVQARTAHPRRDLAPVCWIVGCARLPRAAPRWPDCRGLGRASWVRRGRREWRGRRAGGA